MQINILIICIFFLSAYSQQIFAENESQIVRLRKLRLCHTTHIYFGTVFYTVQLLINSQIVRLLLLFDKSASAFEIVLMKRMRSIFSTKSTSLDHGIYLLAVSIYLLWHTYIEFFFSNMLASVACNR